MKNIRSHSFSGGSRFIFKEASYVSLGEIGSEAYNAWETSRAGFSEGFQTSVTDLSQSINAEPISSVYTEPISVVENVGPSNTTAELSALDQNIQGWIQDLGIGESLIHGDNIYTKGDNGNLLVKPYGSAALPQAPASRISVDSATVAPALGILTKDRINQWARSTGLDLDKVFFNEDLQGLVLSHESLPRGLKLPKNLKKLAANRLKVWPGISIARDFEELSLDSLTEYKIGFGSLQNLKVLNLRGVLPENIKLAEAQSIAKLVSEGKIINLSPKTEIKIVQLLNPVASNPVAPNLSFKIDTRFSDAELMPSPEFVQESVTPRGLAGFENMEGTGIRMSPVPAPVEVVAPAPQVVLSEPVVSAPEFVSAPLPPLETVPLPTQTVTETVNVSEPKMINMGSYEDYLKSLEPAKNVESTPVSVAPLPAPKPQTKTVEDQGTQALETKYEGLENRLKAFDGSVTVAEVSELLSYYDEGEVLELARTKPKEAANIYYQMAILMNGAGENNINRLQKTIAYLEASINLEPTNRRRQFYEYFRSQLARAQAPTPAQPSVRRPEYGAAF